MTTRDDKPDTHSITEQLGQQLTQIQNDLNQLWAIQHWHRCTLQAWLQAQEEADSDQLSYGLSLTHQWIEENEQLINQQLKQITKLCY